MYHLAAQDLRGQPYSGIAMQGALEAMVIIIQALLPIHTYHGTHTYHGLLNVAVSSTHLIHYSQQVAKGFLCLQVVEWQLQLAKTQPQAKKEREGMGKHRN